MINTLTLDKFSSVITTELSKIEYCTNNQHKSDVINLPDRLMSYVLGLKDTKSCMTFINSA